MKQITIDYTVLPASVSDKILGNQGESLATELAVKLPAEMINDGSIAEFCGAFGSRIGVFHSKRIKKSEITDGIFLIPITAEISSKPSVSFQVEAFSSDDSLIMKTSLIEGLTFDKSVCRNHSDLSGSVDPAELANITAEIKANTLARHTHANIETLDKLGETNGNLTYKGREVGSGGSGGSGGKEEIYIGSGEMPEGYVLQIDPEGTSPSTLPAVTDSDNGKVLRVVNGVWDKDEIPAVSEGSVNDVQINGTTIVTDGVANLPIAGTDKVGVIGLSDDFDVDSVGTVSLKSATESQINARSNNPITSENFDLAVKAAMCDGKGAAWTADEQKASRERQKAEASMSKIIDLATSELVSAVEIFVDDNNNTFDLQDFELHIYFPPDYSGSQYSVYLYLQEGDTYGISLNTAQEKPAVNDRTATNFFKVIGSNGIREYEFLKYNEITKCHKTMNPSYNRCQFIKMYTYDDSTFPIGTRIVLWKRG